MTGSARAAVGGCLPAAVYGASEGLATVPADLGQAWTACGGGPLPFETGVLKVFAAGVVRHGSMRRVAAAAGEGAGVVGSAHTAIGIRMTPRCRRPQAAAR